MARAAAANCHSLYGAACANRLHGIGGTGSRRRSGRFRSLSRGSLLARGRGDRSWGDAIGAGRSRQLDEFPVSGRKNTMAGVHDFTAKSLAGEDIPLKRFEGQVLLIVNTASACGVDDQQNLTLEPFQWNVLAGKRLCREIMNASHRILSTRNRKLV